MYVTIRRYEGVQFPNEAAAKVQREFLPIISKIPGFQEYYAIKTGDTVVTSVSVFKDKPGSDESVRAATQWVEKHLSKHLPNPPQITSGDAFAHTSTMRKQSAS